jgi:hypothetical protein
MGAWDGSVAQRKFLDTRTGDRVPFPLLRHGYAARRRHRSLRRRGLPISSSGRYSRLAANRKLALSDPNDGLKRLLPQRGKAFTFRSEYW